MVTNIYLFIYLFIYIMQMCQYTKHAGIMSLSHDFLGGEVAAPMKGMEVCQGILEATIQQSPSSWTSGKIGRGNAVSMYTQAWTFYTVH